MVPAYCGPEWVTRLLSWHGHDRGGVRVPFANPEDRPIGATIETGLVVRLRELATALAEGEVSVPRQIFLIGGPGNGKSQLVEDFCERLDERMEMRGTLVALLADKWRASPLVPREVQVEPEMLSVGADRFRSRIGRLLIIQDASAADTASGTAARELALTVADLATSSEEPAPVFMVCANRGLLAHALKVAHNEWGRDSDPTIVLADLVRASSLGLDALAPDNSCPPCWPIEGNARVACWPMDFDSLLEQRGEEPCAFEQILRRSVLNSAWAAMDACAGCGARAFCPFLQNTEWLSDEACRRALLTILRRGELAAGQRWNFRDSFSLVAELVIGQWDDFGRQRHPCAWVRDCVRVAGDATAGIEDRVATTYALVRRLYPHALFASAVARSEARDSAQHAELEQCDVTLAVANAVLGTSADASKHIRRLLSDNYAPLDPAIHTPDDPTHLLYQLEEEYSQSVEQGNAASDAVGAQFTMSSAERHLLELLGQAEAEWDLLSRSRSRTANTLVFLRRTACALVKRSIGARAPSHANERYLQGYQRAIVDQAELDGVVEALLPLLGEDKFRLDLLEGFGQPEPHDGGRVALVSRRPGVRAFTPMPETPSTPRHDIPYLQVRGPDIKIPVTFDLYLALRLRGEGCAGSSLPASVRAAIDWIKHRYGGAMCRDRASYADRESHIDIAGYGKIGLRDEHGVPTFVGSLGQR